MPDSAAWKDYLVREWGISYKKEEKNWLESTNKLQDSAAGDSLCLRGEESPEVQNWGFYRPSTHGTGILSDRASEKNNPSQRNSN